MSTNSYWLFTPTMLEAALDEFAAAKVTDGMPLDHATKLCSDIREFLARSDAAVNHRLLVEQPDHLPQPRGPGVTG